MKKKRPTPRKLKSGNWNCEVMVDGKRYSVTDEDKAVCQAKAMAIQAGAMEKEEKQKPIKLKDAIDAYIESKSNSLSPSTIRVYEIMKKRRFKGIMNRDIYTLTKRDIQIAVNQEVKDVSPKTVANAYGLVRPVLKDYGIDVFGVKLPQRVKPKKDYIQPEEISKLMNAAKEDKYEAAILMALWLGMRRSEICGLCWDCVDMEKSTVTIRRTLVMDKTNQYVLRDGAKNTSSQRTIQCPDYITGLLKETKRRDGTDRVFTMSPDTLRKHVHSVCAAAGITDTSTHGLRHTNAAIMRHLGISDDHAMQRGGWTEERTYKNIYSYVFESTAKNEDKQIDEWFAKKLKITNEITNAKSGPVDT